MKLVNFFLESVFLQYAKRIYSDKIFSLYVGRKCKEEYNNQNYIVFNERPVEYSFVFKHLAYYCPINILDVGTGTTALPQLMRTCGFKVTAIDNVKDYWPEGMVNRHYYVIDDDITCSKLNQKFDLITCISTLEHIVNFEKAIDNMFRLLNPQGIIILSFPYNEGKYVENVYFLPDSTAPKDLPFSTQVFSRRHLNDWCQRNNAAILEQEYWQYFTGDFWTIGDRLPKPLKTSVDEIHQITCLLVSKL
jgi:SAM-dependent methyltransferase